MAKIPLPLLVFRSVFRIQKSFLSCALLYSPLSSPKLFSTLQLTTFVSEPSLPQRSLSDHMRFMFDQIDSIERERLEKDEALQRIQIWRESQKRDNNSNYLRPPVSEPWVDNDTGEEKEVLVKKQVELVHPWVEWIEFMEMLIRLKYLGPHRKGEDGMVWGMGSHMSEIAEEEVDFTKDYTNVLDAVDRFGKDRFDILSSLSMKDIGYLVGKGCPSSSKKWVINSAKLLRKLAGIDEGEVCCSCSLRSSCHKAFLESNKGFIAQTHDLLHILLDFAFEPVNGSVENKPVFKLKSVKTAARKLLLNVVTLSTVPIDPNLSPPVPKLPKKVKRPRQVRKELPQNALRIGNWICRVCNFMNFSRNFVCLNCDGKKPRRELLPGEWICRGCSLLNFSKKHVCRECQRPRPPDGYSNKIAQKMKEVNAGKRFDRFTKVSKSWNFNFDDAEADGVDVASFERAEGQYIPRIKESGGGLGSDRTSKDLPFPVHNMPGLGFDDFDDDEYESLLVGNDFKDSPPGHESDDLDDDSSVQTISKTGRDLQRKSRTRKSRIRLNGGLDSDAGNGRGFYDDGFKECDERGLGSGSYDFDDNHHGGRRRFKDRTQRSYSDMGIGRCFFDDDFKECDFAPRRFDGCKSGRPGEKPFGYRR